MATTSDYMAGVTIGEGSFGRVVYGLHKSTNREVAIKVVHKFGLKKHPDKLQVILTERRVLEDLKTSDHVVNLWACFHDKECLYFVMECANGGNLTDLIVQGRTDKDWIESAKHYALQILEGLQQIHSHKIIHGDLKPDNILVTLQGQIQLADFGSAVEMLPPDNDKDKDGKKDCPGEGDREMVRGTSDYASPEILRAAPAQELTVAVDLWSYGCIMYTLLQGESPFHAESDALAVEKITDYVKEGVTESERETILFPEIDSAKKEEEEAATTATSSTEAATSSTEAATSSVLPVSTEWKEVIRGLLHPEPLKRLGASDEDKEGSKKSFYPSIRACALWKGVDLELTPKLLPNEPSWLKESKQEEMKDGSMGWTAFLDI
jgi:serine/threonine protein kinase